MIVFAILFLGSVLLGVIVGVAEAMLGWGETLPMPPVRRPAAEIIDFARVKPLRLHPRLSGVSHG